MATVTLRFHPSAEHVRTARLVAVAVARRAGFDEARLDEVRLAVGEICARAVRRCEAAGVAEAVVVSLDDAEGDLVVDVVDEASSDPSDGVIEEPVALALVRGLADDVGLHEGPGGEGGRVRLLWARGRPPRFGFDSP
ncbi:MAG: ATP-binding protein [Kineosporiaceae bacterium]